LASYNSASADRAISELSGSHKNSGSGGKTGSVTFETPSAETTKSEMFSVRTSNDILNDLELMNLEQKRLRCSHNWAAQIRGCRDTSSSIRSSEAHPLRTAMLSHQLDETSGSDNASSTIHHRNTSLAERTHKNPSICLSRYISRC